MRARNSAAILAALLLLPLAAQAGPDLQEPTRARGITLALTAVQPLPPWNDTGFGLAPWVGFTMPAWRNLLATARLGYIGHLEKTRTVGSAATESIRYSSWELPILVGVEYARPGRRGFLLAGEVGYVLRSSSARYSYESATSSIDHGAGLALGAGYRIGRLDLRVAWVMLGLPDPVKQKAIVFGGQWRLSI
jgi:hypothetical protein